MISHQLLGQCRTYLLNSTTQSSSNFFAHICSECVGAQWQFRYDCLQANAAYVPQLLSVREHVHTQSFNYSLYLILLHFVHQWTKTVTKLTSYLSTPFIVWYEKRGAGVLGLTILLLNFEPPHSYLPANGVAFLRLFVQSHRLVWCYPFVVLSSDRLWP